MAVEYLKKEHIKAIENIKEKVGKEDRKILEDLLLEVSKSVGAKREKEREYKRRRRLEDKTYARSEKEIKKMNLKEKEQ